MYESFFFWYNLICVENYTKKRNMVNTVFKNVYFLLEIIIMLYASPCLVNMTLVFIS